MTTDRLESNEAFGKQRDELTEAIRELCQGPGFLSKAGREADVPYGLTELFQVADKEELVDLIYRTLTKLMPPSQYKSALHNALGLTPGGATLTERRNDYGKANKISYRTLIRHEELGAKAMAGVLLVNREDSVGGKLTLEQRVKKLEDEVAELRALLKREVD